MGRGWGGAGWGAVSGVLTAPLAGRSALRNSWRVGCLVCWLLNTDVLFVLISARGARRPDLCTRSNYLAPAHPSPAGRTAPRPGLCLPSALSSPFQARPPRDVPARLGPHSGGRGVADLSRGVQREKNIPELGYPAGG